MVDAGETVSQTVKREFMEEATSEDRFSPYELLRNKQLLDELFAKEQVVYRGYVDDPRNTDHAWMETTAFHFHCNAECAKMLKLEAGDDAAAVRWIDIDDPDVLAGLYASHRDWVDMCAQKLQPHRHCRTDSQLYNYPKRFVVEDEQVPWEVPLPGYDEERPEIKLAPRAARPPKKLTRGDSRAFNLLGRRHSAGEVEDKAPGERRGSMIPRSISDRLPGRGRRQSAQPDFSHLSHLSAVAGKKGERRNSLHCPLSSMETSRSRAPHLCSGRVVGPAHLRPESRSRTASRKSLVGGEYTDDPGAPSATALEREYGLRRHSHTGEVMPSARKAGDSDDPHQVDRPREASDV